MLNFPSVRGVNASPRLIEWVCGVCIALMALIFVSPAIAEKGKLRERLTPEVMAVVFPGGAERLGPEEGSPPAIAVYQGGQVAAYVFSTLDIIAAPGYSTTPFDVIAGVDLGGRITGAKVVFHNEPYIVHDAQRQRLLDTFLAREAVSASPRDWCCAPASRGPLRRLRPPGSRPQLRPSMSKASAASPGTRSSPPVPSCAGG